MSRWIIHSSLQISDSLKRMIKTIRTHHAGAEFVDLCTVETSKGSGRFTDDPVFVFWQPHPPEGYHPYFVYFYRDEYPGQNNPRLYITSGESFNPEVEALLIPNKSGSGGQLIYSRFRHDYFVSPDGKNSIDGGRDYIRHTLPENGEIVTLNIHTGIFSYGGELYQARFTKEREALRYYGPAPYGIEADAQQ